MAKAELTTVVTPKCQRLADEMGYELVDVCLDKENTEIGRASCRERV